MKNAGEAERNQTLHTMNGNVTQGSLWETAWQCLKNKTEFACDLVISFLGISLNKLKAGLFEQIFVHPCLPSHRIIHHSQKVRAAPRLRSIRGPGFFLQYWGLNPQSFPQATSAVIFYFFNH